MTLREKMETMGKSERATVYKACDKGLKVAAAGTPCEILNELPESALNCEVLRDTAYQGLHLIVYKPASNLINHPEHYTYGAHECIDEMRILFGKEAVINYCKLAAYKYKYRCGHKGNDEDAKRDMQKADWYISKAEELQNG